MSVKCPSDSLLYYFINLGREKFEEKDIMKIEVCLKK